MMRKMGPIRSVISHDPGLGKQMQGVNVDERELELGRAIVLSMTPEERRNRSSSTARGGPGSRAGAARPSSRSTSC